MIECTIITREALRNATGLEHRPGQMQTYADPTGRIKDTIQGKVKQLGREAFPSPRLLILAAHDEEFGLITARLAESLVAPVSAIRVRLEGGLDEHELVHDWSASALYTPTEGGVQQVRQAISAVLLMSAGHDRTTLCGLVNPHANYPFDPLLLPKVPWLTISELVDGIRPEWVWHDQGQKTAYPDLREAMISYHGEAGHSALTVHPRLGS